MNRDIEQSARPAVATVRESVACRAASARPAPARPVPARPVPLAAGLDRPPESEGKSPITGPTTLRKQKPACPIEALRTLQHVRKNSYKPFCLAFARSGPTYLEMS